MPTYEYKCPECQAVEHHQHKMNEQPNYLCLRCGQNNKLIPMQKGVGGGTAVHFKGSGFYETDYKAK